MVNYPIPPANIGTNRPGPYHYVAPLNGGFGDGPGRVFGATRDTNYSGGAMSHRWHSGVDVSGSGPVGATIGGTILTKTVASGYGPVIDILGDDGNVWRYALHVPAGSQPDAYKSLKVGARVEAGQQIGVAGRLPGGKFEHLHWEVFTPDNPNYKKVISEKGGLASSQWKRSLDPNKQHPYSSDISKVIGVPYGAKFAYGKPIGGQFDDAIKPPTAVANAGIGNLYDQSINNGMLSNIPNPQMAAGNIPSPPERPIAEPGAFSSYGIASIPTPRPNPYAAPAGPNFDTANAGPEFSPNIRPDAGAVGDTALSANPWDQMASAAPMGLPPPTGPYTGDQGTRFTPHVPASGGIAAINPNTANVPFPPARPTNFDPNIANVPFPESRPATGRFPSVGHGRIDTSGNPMVPNPTIRPERGLGVPEPRARGQGVESKSELSFYKSADATFNAPEYGIGSLTGTSPIRSDSPIVTSMGYGKPMSGIGQPTGVPMGAAPPMSGIGLPTGVSMGVAPPMTGIGQPSGVPMGVPPQMSGVGQPSGVPMGTPPVMGGISGPPATTPPAMPAMPAMPSSTTPSGIQALQQMRDTANTLQFGVDEDRLTRPSMVSPSGDISSSGFIDKSDWITGSDSTDRLIGGDSRIYTPAGPQPNILYQPPNTPLPNTTVVPKSIAPTTPAANLPSPMPAAALTPPPGLLPSAPPPAPAVAKPTQVTPPPVGGGVIPAPLKKEATIDKTVQTVVKKADALPSAPSAPTPGANVTGGMFSGFGNWGINSGFNAPVSSQNPSGFSGPGYQTSGTYPDTASQQNYNLSNPNNTTYKASNFVKGGLIKHLAKQIEDRTKEPERYNTEEKLKRALGISKDKGYNSEYVKLYNTPWPEDIMHSPMPAYLDPTMPEYTHVPMDRSPNFKSGGKIKAIPHFTEIFDMLPHDFYKR